ncbi:DUF3265 domain-containing protein [Vibrio metschnikovii]|nr:DUF3265 domain-containing protein [Vibrio metschnikovii]MBC5814768.1 DUF3265 domain-containing protein [Vibrio metschnikovii]
MQADPQRVAFLLCVEFGDNGVMREVGSCVSGYLIGRYIFVRNHNSKISYPCFKV